MISFFFVFLAKQDIMIEIDRRVKEILISVYYKTNVGFMKVNLDYVI